MLVIVLYLLITIASLVYSSGCDIISWLFNSPEMVINSYAKAIGANYGIRTNLISGSSIIPFGLIIIIAILLILYLSKKYSSISAVIILAGIQIALLFTCGKANALLVCMVVISTVTFIYEAKNSKKDNLLTSVIKASVCLVTLAICLLVSSLLSTNASSIHYGISDIKDEVIYGGDSTLPSGNVATDKTFAPDGSPCLEVTMESPDSYYLRGFIGSDYIDGRWDSVSNAKKYTYRDTFYYLHKDGFYGQTQLGNINRMLTSDYGSEISITNTGASSKYTYAPYEVLETELIDENKLGDESLSTSGNSYSYLATHNAVGTYTSLAADLNNKLNNITYGLYLNSEAHYNEYVYDLYTDIPERYQSFMHSVFGDIDISDDSKHADYGVAKARILKYLSENYYYDTDSAYQGDDPIMSFLQSGKCGYSIHFASAAVMMFRYMGIPARYVEGYIITPSDIADVNPGDMITVTNNSAHAWVEFYQDGIGWIPFEVTPAYLGLMDSADDLSTSQNVVTYKPKEETNQLEEGVSEALMQTEKNRAILPIILAVILVLIIICIKPIRKYIHTKNLIKSFDSEDRTKAAINMMVYLKMLIAKKKLSLEEEDDYKKCYEIYQKAAFSRNPITREEIIYFKAYITNIKKS